MNLYKQLINEQNGSEKVTMPDKNLNNLPLASYMMCMPITMNTDNPNNIWMDEYDPKDLKVDKKKAYKQFLDLYNYLSSDGLVYILPHEGNFQDQVYVANVGLVLPQSDKMQCIASNYKSTPRIGEENVFVNFMNMMGYEVKKPPYTWEGEADIKFLYGNKYIGGTGIRTNPKSYDWMMDNYDMNIVKVEMKDDYLYHLDCSVFPIDNDNTLVCTEIFNSKEIKSIEKYTNIIDVGVDSCYNGITNCVRFYNTICCASDLEDLDKKSDDYKVEFEKVKSLEKICCDLGMEPVFFNISEFYKSGAALSCCVLHLNRFSYNINLI